MLYVRIKMVSRTMRTRDVFTSYMCEHQSVIYQLDTMMTPKLDLASSTGAKSAKFKCASNLICVTKVQIGVKYRR